MGNFEYGSLFCLLRQKCSMAIRTNALVCMGLGIYGGQESNLCLGFLFLSLFECSLSSSARPIGRVGGVHYKKIIAFLYFCMKKEYFIKPNWTQSHQNIANTPLFPPTNPQILPSTKSSNLLLQTLPLFTVCFQFHQRAPTPSLFFPLLSSIPWPD